MFYLESTNPKDNIIINLNSSPLVNEIEERACLFVQNLGLSIPFEKIRIHFVIQEEMDRLDPNASGLCFQNNDGTYDIYVRYGYTFIYSKSVLAHELGHTWLLENDVKLSQMETEGFCQLLAYQFLASDFSELGNDEMCSLRNWSDKVYGDGFRLMKTKLDSLGWAQLLLLLKTTFKKNYYGTKI